MIRRTVREPIFAGVPTSWEVEVGVVGRSSAIGWDVVDEGPAHCARWFLPSTAPGQTVHLRRDVTLPNRGPYRCPPLRASSAFPFGLVRREVEFSAAEQLLVLPRWAEFTRGACGAGSHRRLGPMNDHADLDGALALEAEFHGLRQFRPGDSPRWIHWRTSARTGELVVREFDHGTHYDLILIVEPFADSADSDALESAISLAATVCWAWAQEAGDRVTLAIAGAEPVVLTGGDGPGAVFHLMEALATASGTAEVNAVALGRRLLEGPLLRGPALLISSQPEPRTAEMLTRMLDRPVAFLSAANKPSFYQPPA